MDPTRHPNLCLSEVLDFFPEVLAWHQRAKLLIYSSKIFICSCELHHTSSPFCPVPKRECLKLLFLQPSLKKKRCCDDIKQSHIKYTVLNSYWGNDESCITDVHVAVMSWNDESGILIRWREDRQLRVSALELCQSTEKHHSNISGLPNFSCMSELWGQTGSFGILDYIYALKSYFFSIFFSELLCLI